MYIGCLEEGQLTRSMSMVGVMVPLLGALVELADSGESFKTGLVQKGPARFLGGGMDNRRGPTETELNRRITGMDDSDC